jgi:Tol biopolymer transport system component
VSLATGQSLAHYEILGSLGAGAMGEVYRARDTRLGREVALKVLPEELAGDEERLQRFEREAKALASLNHPAVAQVYGIDQAGDTCFIAMELVPGEDLEARLARGRLRIQEALDVCRQIAEGVEAAHEAGVIHRDLKPANVILAPDGRAKVLDFGLAKAAGDRGAAEPTKDSVLTTQEGRLLGTPSYMAPEQARGKPVDRRADVWALGCVLFECLTGRRPFGGETLGDVLAAVLEKEPDWSALPSGTSLDLRRLLRRCLCKEPRARLQHAGDVRVLLEELIVAAPDAAPARSRRGTLITTLLLAGTTVAALVGWLRPAGDGGGAEAFLDIHPITFGIEWDGSPGWSPENERIVFTRMVAGSSDLFVKSVVGESARPLVQAPGDQYCPRWSPDRVNVAYLSSGSPGAPLCLMRAEGVGEPRELADTNASRLSINTIARCMGDRPWIDGNRLVFSRALPTGQLALHQVDIETEELTQLTFPPVGAEDLGASLSFDGAWIAFERRENGNGRLWTMPASGGEARAVLVDEHDNTSPAWTPDGKQVYFRAFRGGTFRNLWALDLAGGDVRPVTNLTKDIWDYSVASDGRLAVHAFWHDTFLRTIDVTTGEEVELTTHRGDNFGGRCSPDGRHVAYHSSRSGNTEVWSLDLETGEETNLTEHPAFDLYPDWSPDGSEIVFVSNRDGAYHLFVMRADGGAKRKIVHDPVGVEGTRVVNSALIARWSPDGRRIAFIKAGPDGNSVWTVDPHGGNERLLLPRVFNFDWLGPDRAVFSRQEAPGEDMVMYAVDLDSLETHELYRGPHVELDVAPNGSAVAFCSGLGHLGMKPHVLALEPGANPGDLPRAGGDPVPLYPLESQWHVHIGGWSGDSERLLFTYDHDYGDIFVLETGR